MGAAPTADDIKKVLPAGGVEAADEALTRLMAAVEGKTIDDIAQLVTEGSKKLVNIGGGGGAAPAAGGAAAAVVESRKRRRKRRRMSAELAISSAGTTRMTGKHFA